MSDTVYDKLGRIRKPRVHITYDVETDGAVIERELPFVVGLMGDYVGDTTAGVKPLVDRKFVQIDRDNFDGIMGRMAPSLNLKVDNTLAGDGSQIPVNLTFKSMDDFEPAKVAEQVPVLKALLETRARLRDLVSKADQSEELETLLEQVLSDKNKLDALSAELGIKTQEG